MVNYLCKKFYAKICFAFILSSALFHQAYACSTLIENNFLTATAKTNESITWMPDIFAVGISSCWITSGPSGDLPLGAAATVAGDCSSGTFIADQAGVYSFWYDSQPDTSLIPGGCSILGDSGPGRVTVTVTDPVPAAPQITGFWSFRDDPGAIVFTFGANFVKANTAVAVNNVSAPISTVLDDGLLLFLLPGGDTAGPISVTTDFGTAASSIDFGVPIVGLAVTGLWPAEGAEGSIIFVFGNDFDPAFTEVAVNGIVAPFSQALDSSLLLFMVPPGATTGPISVTTGAGTTLSAIDFVVK